MSCIYGNKIALSKKGSDHLLIQQAVTLDNIANVDTPGFKSQHMTSEKN